MFGNFNYNQSTIIILFLQRSDIQCKTRNLIFTCSLLNDICNKVKQWNLGVQSMVVRQSHDRMCLFPSSANYSETNKITTNNNCWTASGHQLQEHNCSTLIKNGIAPIPLQGASPTFGNLYGWSEKQGFINRQFCIWQSLGAVCSNNSLSTIIFWVFS